MTEAPQITDVHDEPELRDAAVRRLKKKQDFRAHVLVYVLVNATLWLVWALTSSRGFPWPVFPMAGWGIGLVMNAWDVYGRRPITETDVRREIDRMRGGVA